MRTTTARVQGSAAASSNCSRNNDTGFSPIELGPTMSISSNTPSTVITATDGPPLHSSCRGTVNGWSEPEFPGVAPSLVTCPSAHTVELVLTVGAWQQPANSMAAKAKVPHSFCAKPKTQRKGSLLASMAIRRGGRCEYGRCRKSHRKWVGIRSRRCAMEEGHAGASTFLAFGSSVTTPLEIPASTAFRGRVVAIS